MILKKTGVKWKDNLPFVSPCTNGFCSQDLASSQAVKTLVAERRNLYLRDQEAIHPDGKSEQ